MNLAKKHLLVLLVWSATLLTLLSAPRVQAQSCVVTGTIYRDYDQDGTRDTREPAVPGIRVTAFGANGNALGSANSGANGVYTLSGLPDAQQVRVEFSQIPTYLRSGRAGVASNTTVTFFDCGTSANPIDFGVNNPGQYCQGDPTLATSCYTLGYTLNQTDDSIIGFDYTAGAVGGPETAFDQPGHDTYAAAQQVGTTWGMAYQGASNSLFVSAFMKRHTGFGPSGPGAIYRIDLNTNTTTTFLTLNAGSDPHPTATDAQSWARDVNSWDSVGKIGLGDLEISENGRVLYTINLADRRLYSIPIGIPPVAGSPSAVAIPRPGGCAAGDWRPFGLGINDGLVYVGGVCSAESTQSAADLRAHVYSYNPANGNFNLVFSTPLTYPRRCTSMASAPTCETESPAEWNAWRPTFGGIFETVSSTFVYPQPWLTDIVFDNGDMILGLRDRFGDQSGNQAFSTDPADNTNYLGINAGDILRACASGGGWTLENNATCGANTGSGAGNAQGPGGGEYYSGENLPGFHDELFIGGLAQVPGQQDLIAMVFDPIPYGSIESLFDAGVRWINNDTGAYTRAFRVFPGDFADPDFFGKANGLGDIEALCAPAPIEIGNRVWFDNNRNGVQDPGAVEFPVPGVTVNLYDSAGTLVGTTTTAADGEYYFNETNVAGGLLIEEDYRIRLDNPSDYAVGGPLEGWTITRPNAGTDMNDNDGRIRNNYPTIDMATGDYGENDHTFDFGFVVDTGVTDTPEPDVTPGGGGNTPQPNQEIFTKQVDPPFAQPGDTVNWTLTIRNPNNTPINNVRVTDNIPAPLEIISTNATAGTVTVNGLEIIFTIAQLAPGQTVTITITTRLPLDADPVFIIENTARFTGEGYDLGAQARLVRAGELVSAGETPWWRLPLIGIVAVLSVMAVFLTLRRRRT